ncbi:MAG TPA: hypothetical protein VFT43_04805 [Candidatus Polarisedimenticolia bacterium]|nr:hypothetical protein [Candidatus Polarisedimenticolia bacterium]
MTDLPVACTLSDADWRERRSRVLEKVLGRVQERRPLEDGYALRFATDDVVLAELLQLIQLERQCCAFLRFRLTVEPGGGPVWLELTGPPGTKSFLETLPGLAPETRSPDA